MKIKAEHVADMAQAIAGVDTEENRKVYREGKFLRAECTKDVNKRYRWDLLYAAKSSRWIIDNLYPYANDDHIDTALRSIVKVL